MSLLIALKFGAILLGAVSGLIGTLTDTKIEGTDRRSAWGKLLAVLIVISGIVAMASQFEEWREDLKTKQAEEAKTALLLQEATHSAEGIDSAYRTIIGVHKEIDSSALNADSTRRYFRKIAHADLRLALRQITWIYFELFDDARELESFSLVPSHILDTGRLAKIYKILYDTTPWIPALSGATIDIPWYKALENNSDLGKKQIDLVLQTYSSFLEPELVAVVREARSSFYLDAGFHPEILIHYRRGWPDGGFYEFWNTMKQLDKMLPKDADFLRPKTR